jgi:hypothetical protein
MLPVSLSPVNWHHALWNMLITCIHTKTLGQPSSSIKNIKKFKISNPLALPPVRDFHPYRCAHVHTCSLHSCTLMHNCLRKQPCINVHNCHPDRCTHVHTCSLHSCTLMHNCLRNNCAQCTTVNLNRRASHACTVFPSPTPTCMVVSSTTTHYAWEKELYPHICTCGYSSFSHALVGPYPKLPLYDHPYPLTTILQISHYAGGWDH